MTATSSLLPRVFQGQTMLGLPGFFLPDQWRILDTWRKAKEVKHARQGLQQPTPPSVASGSQESEGGKGSSGKIGG